MPAVDASSLTKLAKTFSAASKNVPGQLQSSASEGQALVLRDLSQAIGGRYNLTPDVLGTIQVKAQGKYGFAITGPERPIMVNRGYRATQTKQGLQFAIEKGRQTVLKNGFISKVKKLALKRSTNARLPVVAVTGPAVGTILSDPRFTTPIINKSVAAIAQNATARIEGGLNRG